ncbi:hypothetical protein LTR53_017533 [Teratosphaeriaceae sp. CCFEE 6253]|nr:hypothetical protein LTR53_017533 [Teratosphaeriaceae sp. CCFEE 6253]
MGSMRAGTDYGTSTAQTSRVLPAVVALIAALHSLLFALVCSYLPDDPLYISVGLSVYAWAGSAVSMFGLIGILTDWTAPVTAFAHHMLLDTLLSTICRLLVLRIFTTGFQPAHVCGDNPWSRNRRSHDVVTSPRSRSGIDGWTTRFDTCTLTLYLVESFAVAILIALTAAQGTLAMAMRRYGKGLADQTSLPDPEVAAIRLVHKQEQQN